MEKYYFYLLDKEKPSIVKKIFKSNLKNDLMNESKKYIKSKFKSDKSKLNSFEFLLKLNKLHCNILRNRFHFF